MRMFSVFGVLNRPNCPRTEALSAGHRPRGGAAGRRTFSDSRTSSSMYASQADAHVTTTARFNANFHRARIHHRVGEKRRVFPEGPTTRVSIFCCRREPLMILNHTR